MAIVNTSVNLKDFWDKGASRHQLNPGATRTGLLDDFSEKTMNQGRDDGQIIDMYGKLNLRGDGTPQTGWINEPYIMRGIQRKRKKTPQYWGAFGLGKGLKRGGHVFATGNGIVRGGLAAIERPIFDGLRLGKFMVDMKGILFMAQQIGLQASNPKLEIAGSLEAFALSGIVNRPTRVYNPLTTVLQSVGVGAGLHLQRHGLLSDLSLYDGGYGKIVSSRNENSLSFGETLGVRSMVLDQFVRYSKVDGSYNSTYNRMLLLTEDSFMSRMHGPFGVRNIKGQKYEYLSGKAGPNSFYGLGRTDIIRYEDTEPTTVNKLPLTFKHMNWERIRCTIAVKED